jgi:hypothetical protein
VSWEENESKIHHGYSDRQGERPGRTVIEAKNSKRGVKCRRSSDIEIGNQQVGSTERPK